MKKIYFSLLFAAVIALAADAQSNMYIQGTQTWNTTNTNWGSTSGSSGKVWKNDSIANLELSPIITLNGFNPFMYGINCTSTGSVTSAASERIYLAGTVSPVIDVSAGQTLTLNNIMAGGRGFTKSSAGNLIFGNGNNRFLNFANGISINAGTIDFTSSAAIAAGALRCMPVNFGGGALQYTGATASDMRFGGLSGTGTLSLGAANNGFEFILANASTAATITGAGFSLRGTGGAVQTLTGNTSGLTATIAVHGVSTLNGAGGTTSGLTLSGAGSNTFNNATNNFGIRGGRFTVDNTTNNLTNRFPTAATSGMLNFLGGTFELLGNSAGTSFTIGSGYATTAKATAFNAGQNNIIVNQPVGATAPTILTFGAGPTPASLRDATRMTINFSSTGNGTLGASATDPQIKYATAPIINAGAAAAPSNMFANTATGATVGWATVNNTDWATYGANGVVARANDLTTATTAGLQAGTVTQAVLFNPGVAPAAATGNVVSSVITFEPTVTGLTLPMGAFTMAGIALMHRGANDFTITGTAGILTGSSATRYIYVMNPAATLSTDALLNSANPITKSGDGTLALTGTSSQISFAANQNINLCGGVLRGTAAALNGATSAGGAFSTINFYGGILELDGGMTFVRAIDLSGTAAGGGINFDVSATQRGSGGFSAINGSSTVTLVTTVGGATPATLLWNNGAWLSDGYSLLMGSPLATGGITLTNDIQLDDGAATNSYTAREIYVYNGPSGQEGELSGVISGGPNADFIKSGPGSLLLSGANTFSGNIIIAEGELVISGTGLPATASVLVKSGARLSFAFSSIKIIKDLILEPGAIVAFSAVSTTLTITGNFTDNGVMVGGGNSIVSFNGTSQQYIDGTATTLLRLQINNPSGMHILTPLTINGLSGGLTFTSGIINTSAANLLTIAPLSGVSGASNSSFVDGPIAKEGNGSFTFPVGKPNCGPSGTVNGYAPLMISNFTGGTPSDRYIAEYKRGDALSLGANATAADHISRCDYWTLTRDNGASTVDITLYWDDPINNCSSSTPYINNLPSLTIVHSNNPGNWDAMGSVGGFGTTTTGNVPWTGTQSSTFGAFAIASTDFNNPLPISINYFTGAKQNTDHLLNWKVTCNSTPSVTMELQRSGDGRAYSGIHTINATATECMQPFSYTDHQPLAGINYYRLKIRDANGKISYSSIVSLINATAGIDILTIAPNPIQNRNFKLNISAAQKTQMDIIITDMQGRLLQKQTVNAIAGFNTVPVNVGHLATGTYQVYAITAEGRSKVLRFVIQ
jgi:autotransporter-associated beta strand protein